MPLFSTIWYKLQITECENEYGAGYSFKLMYIIM